jgi:hypothetical protein
MKRRQLLATLAATVPAVAFGRSREPSAKKGWAGGDASMHKLFGANWYYTWSPKTRPSKAAEFVPMIKGEWSLRQAADITRMSGISHLLGFNEPERQSQGNVTLGRALELWPKLTEIAEAKNLQLGSPAPSSDRGGMEWFGEFMKQAKRRKLRIDFVAMHWYRSRNADDFEDFVKDLARSYRLPIWITEFNGWSGPEKEHYEFVKDSLKFLERNRDVDRYAYFNPGRGKPHSLLKNDGSLTRIGELYRDAGN